MLTQETCLWVTIPIPQEIADKIKQAKKESRMEYATHDDIPPHITLYLCRFDSKKFGQLKDKLKETKFDSLSVTLERVDVQYNRNKDNYFFSIQVKSDSQIMGLHNQIISFVNPLRDLLIRTKDQVRINEWHYKWKEEELIKQYGYVRVKENFRPHATLGEGEDKAQSILLEQKLSTLLPHSFEVEEISFHLYSQNPDTWIFKKYWERNKHLSLEK